MALPRKKAPAKKKTTPKAKFKLEAQSGLENATLSFDSESARDIAVAQLSGHIGIVSQGLKYCITDDTGCEFRYLTIKGVAKK
jgi:hypothetical protein